MSSEAGSSFTAGRFGVCGARTTSLRARRALGLLVLAVGVYPAKKPE